MANLTLVHLSDLHFAADNYLLDPEVALEKVCDILRRDYPREEFMIAVTGDITTRGRTHGYRDAARAIRQTLLDVTSRDRLLFCPGNHDISLERNPFSPYNEFVFDVTNKSTMGLSRQEPVHVTEREGYAFILVNSSFHGDHRYGTVPISELREKLAATDCPSIVLVHHSPVASIYGGAALSNAYEFLSLTAGAQACGILHGHIHSEQVLSIGKRPTFLAGVGSLSFAPDANMNNHFAVHTIEDGALVSSRAYRYTADRQDFLSMELTWP